MAERVIKRLDREFAFHFHVESVLWEREPLVAAHHFQEEITPPHDTDIVVVILWSRLGVPLPEAKFAGPLSAGPVTGTEWEFEDALHAYRTTQPPSPDLLVYRKQAEITTALTEEKAVLQRLEQKRLVEDFIDRWFYDKQSQSFIAAFHQFTEIAEFKEKLEDHLRMLIFRRLKGIETSASVRYPGNPFRGLLSFEPQDSPIFFGRTRAAGELVERLRRQEERGCAFVAVIGASGSGKSSLVKAGLLPDLMLPGMIGKVALCRWAVMRPSENAADPTAALAHAILSETALPELLALEYTETGLAEQLASHPSQAAFAVRQGLASARQAAGLTEVAEARLIIVVDQLEELFTQKATSQDARAAFVATLAALAQSGLVWVVATLRSDYYDRIATLPGLAALATSDAQYMLGPPSSAEVGQMIREPAHEAGLVFQADLTAGLGLDEVIRQAADRNPGALPLLSFLLDQLWRQRTPTGMLTFEAYRDLGGLEGALGQRAEEVFQGLSADAQAQLKAVLRKLVTVGSDGTASARTADVSSFARNPGQQEFVQAFLHEEARLLVAFGSAGGAQVRVAHEALLTHWERARAEIAAETRDLELLSRLERAARHWRAAAVKDRDSLVLAGGLPLTEARALVRAWGEETPPEVAAFVRRSRQVHLARRSRLALNLAAAAAALPLIGALAWVVLTWLGVRAVEREMAFVHLPANCFIMGSALTDPQRYPNEAPHRVCLAAFDIGRFDVTQDEWRQVMLLDPNPARFKGSRDPVETINWYQAEQFIGLMSFFGSRKYSLPSESQWEYADRAGTTTERYWGDRAEDGCAYANMRDLSYKTEYPEEGGTVDCNDGALFTTPVGSYKPNGFGLYDMQGNVFQWVADCYLVNEAAAPADGRPATTGDCKKRVVRGGAWYTVPRHMRSAYREAYDAPTPGYVGFRLVRQ